jgi:hypothetical protein
VVSTWGDATLAPAAATQKGAQGETATHTCRFCGANFDKATALGGHMGTHKEGEDSGGEGKRAKPSNRRDVAKRSSNLEWDKDLHKILEMGFNFSY